MAARALAGEDIENIGKVLNSALDAGINVIDTAECYEGSEESIGNAIRKRRAEFFLFTKCGHPRGIGSEDWSAKSILESIERSLRRLQTDRIDLIQLHGSSEGVPEEGRSDFRVGRKRVSAAGCATSAIAEMVAPTRFALECDAFDALQTSINIADQEAISQIVPLARARATLA